LDVDGNLCKRWRAYPHLEDLFTKDGRSVTWETTGPSNVVPPLSPIFEENPELKRNEIKQIDYAAEGADVTVNRTVWLNGQTYFSDVIQTHYQPWQAICQYGTDTENPDKKAKNDGKCLPPDV